MSTSIDVAVRPVPVPAVPPAFFLTADLIEFVAARKAVQLAFERLRLSREARELQQRSDEAFEALHLSDTGGWGGADDDAERLRGEADDAWKRAATGWAAALFVPEDVRDAAREFAGRPRVVNTAVPLSGDWRKSVGRVNWSLGRDGVA